MVENLLGGLSTAFSMYSIVPVKTREWNKNTMKYALMFFPFVGVLISFCMILWSYFCNQSGFNSLFFAAGSVAIPLVITGGIHMDGFIDTVDGISSRADIPKKLEILKDPHVGAFSVLWSSVYLLVQFALFSQFYESQISIILFAFIYPLSRIFSTLAIISFQKAKNTGLVHLFSENADKKNVSVVMYVYIFIAIFLMIFLNFIYAILISLMLPLLFLLFNKMCIKQFGGITGDLAGYFVQLLELFVLFFITVGGFILWFLL